MKDPKRILVISRDTKSAVEPVSFGISLAKKYGAELYILHVTYDPFFPEEWNLPIPNVEGEYKRMIKEAREDIERLVLAEKRKGMPVMVQVKDGEPTASILDTVKEVKADLMIMLAHEEGRLEHFLFGRSNEAILRKVPCSILMIKKEPDA
jgi:nucleotide-binding universal stress UspA family protein